MATAAWGGWRGGRGAQRATVAGAVALLAVLVVSLAMEAPVIGDSGTVAPGGWFDGHLVPTNYMRLVVALWALDAVVVTGIAWLIGGLPVLRGLLAGTLAAITGGGAIP